MLEQVDVLMGYGRRIAPVQVASGFDDDLRFMLTHGHEAAQCVGPFAPVPDRSSCLHDEHVDEHQRNQYALYKLVASASHPKVNNQSRAASCISAGSIGFWLRRLVQKDRAELSEVKIKL